MSPVSRRRLSGVVPRSAAAAYRADLGGRESGFDPRDDGWIAVATLLEHAALVPAEYRAELIRDAIELSCDALGEAECQRLGHREWQDRDRTPVDAIFLIAEVAHVAGAIHLAAVILDAITVVETSLTVVQQGRVLAMRASVAWKLGDIDDAARRYRRVAKWGRQTQSAELKVRAWLGLAALAQMRGNYPEVVRHCRRAALLAERSTLRHLLRHAHNGLMVAAGAQHRFDEALTHAWAVYQASVGDALDEGEILTNIGQMLLEAGQIAAARAAFSSVVARPLPAFVLLPALGGLAVASAASDDAETVAWAMLEIERIEQMPVPRYAVAEALLECATALAAIEHRTDADRLRRRAAALATTNGFHEIEYRAEALDVSECARTAAPARPLDARATSVAREVIWMEPPQLPSHVMLNVAAA